MLTRKQLDLLTFIHARIQRDGVPPSFDEMKDALDLRSKSGIHRLITALEERGYVRRLAHRARAIEILRLPDNLTDGTVTPMRRKPLAPEASQAQPRSGTARAPGTPLPDTGGPDAPMADAGGLPVFGGAQEIPVMGRIAAGTPIAAIEQVSHHVAVPDALMGGGGRHYALEVRGDSMIDAGINNGDVVVIRSQDSADNGDIVVALVEGQEATLKRLRRRGSAIALEAANPAYETRLYRAEQVQIQGRLVGLIRSY